MGRSRRPECDRGSALALTVSVTACGGSDEASGGGKLAVATTVAPITSIVANIGGDRVQITGIVPEGTNSHTFEPEPSVAELLSSVDVVYVNGLVLEEPTKELAEENLRDGAEIVELGARCIERAGLRLRLLVPRVRRQAEPAPLDRPEYALCYAGVARDDLSARDPDNADYYAANYEEFAGMVDEFDAAMRESFATIPKRELLTYHDAYAYFARDYDWDVIGAIQVSDFEDPTPKEVARLIEQVRDERGAGDLRLRGLPEPGARADRQGDRGARTSTSCATTTFPASPAIAEHSWVGLMHFDYVTMTEALGGDASALKAFAPRNVAPDEAEYPQ